MNRTEFVLLFDITDGNPNGDPDADNTPRTDAETGEGLTTDVCIKRKVRNYVDLTRAGKPGYDIYVREKAVLNLRHKHAYTELKLDPSKKDAAATDKARAWMCQNFYDVRTFGAVMSTGEKGQANCGQVRGPVQLAFSRSIDPVTVAQHTITRIAVASEKEAHEQSGDNRTMGRKYTIPYALYRMHGFVNPYLGEQTGFSDEDLNLFWQALTNMFEFDRSAGRGLMGARRLIVFEHESKLGNAPAYKLFELVKIQKRAEVPRCFSDYEVAIGEVPSGVTVVDKI
jgi:CRISPR-associated protein Csd2